MILKSLLASKTIKKVGKNVTGNLTRLRHYVEETHGEMELGTFCFNRQAIESSGNSLSLICSSVLGLSLPKIRDIRMSNWETNELSDHQKNYAVLDAYISIAIYNKVKTMQLVNEKVTQHTPPGTFVGVYPKNSSKLLSASAYEYICNLNNEDVVPTTPTGILLPKTNKIWPSSTSENAFTPIVEASQHDPSSTSNNTSSNDTPTSSTTSTSTATKPSRILKDTFHLIEQIPVSLRHGMAKDFKRRFKDCFFVVDQEDKKKVEEYLKCIGTDWDTHLITHSDFVWERVRRYIPPPDTLVDLLEDFFIKYENVVCVSTDRKLFDKEIRAASLRVLEQVKAGYVSDVVDGPPLYTEKGMDKNGLMRYACSRGTSSVEGACHFNVIRKFPSFNAGRG
ncbi:unnamed protein product [Mucor hiemalis]